MNGAWLTDSNLNRYHYFIKARGILVSICGSWELDIASKYVEDKWNAINSYCKECLQQKESIERKEGEGYEFVYS